MNMPGFTAEATFHKRSECYDQKAGDVVASRNGAGILPALRTTSHSHRSVRFRCAQNRGVYWSEGPTTSTYGCMYPDGSGIVCGGQTSEEKGSCDTF